MTVNGEANWRTHAQDFDPTIQFGQFALIYIACQSYLDYVGLFSFDERRSSDLIRERRWLSSK